MLATCSNGGLCLRSRSWPGRSLRGALFGGCRGGCSSWTLPACTPSAIRESDLATPRRVGSDASPAMNGFACVKPPSDARTSERGLNSSPLRSKKFPLSGWTTVGNKRAWRKSVQKIGRTHHRHRPGRDVFSRRLAGSRLFYLLGSNLLRPVELGPVDPHAMQNDCELARDRDLGLTEPRLTQHKHHTSRPRKPCRIVNRCLEGERGDRT